MYTVVYASLVVYPGVKALGSLFKTVNPGLKALGSLFTVVYPGLEALGSLLFPFHCWSIILLPRCEINVINVPSMGPGPPLCTFPVSLLVDNSRFRKRG